MDPIRESTTSGHHLPLYEIVLKPPNLPSIAIRRHTASAGRQFLPAVAVCHRRREEEVTTPWVFRRREEDPPAFAFRAAVMIRKRIRSEWRRG